MYLLLLHVHARPKVASPFLTATRAKPQGEEALFVEMSFKWTSASHPLDLGLTKIWIS